MRNLNFPLLLGSIIVILLIIVSLYPALFTSNDPLFEESPKYIEYKEEGVWIEKFAQNPMPPNRENVFGTDDAGRDVYARLIYGASNTMKLALLIAIFRFVLALPLGLAAGMGIRLISKIIKIFNTFFTAIPMLLFSYVVLKIGYFKNLEIDRAIIAFALVLAIVGWAKLAGVIEDLTRRVMEEDFIEGEIAIGKTKLKIALQNVLPHIIPSSIGLFFKEIGLVLFIIAQLAVLFIFVGIARRLKGFDLFKTNYIMVLEPEWGGTLSRLAINIRRYEKVYWMTFYPILFFSVAIIGLNLTGEGLRLEFQKRDSRVISSIRKVSYMISPRLFIYQIKEIKKYYKPVIIKSTIILSIIAYITIPWHPSHYKFDLNYAKQQLKELTKEKYGGRVTGTEGGYLAGEYIIDTLKSYGYQVNIQEFPLIIEEESHPSHLKPVLTPMLVESGWIKLTRENGEEKIYQLHKDFTIASLSRNIFIDKVKDTVYYNGVATFPQNQSNIPKGIDYFAIESEYYGLYYDRNFNPNTLRNGTMIRLDSQVQFILNEGLSINKNAYLFELTTIIPFNELRGELESGYKEVEICFDYPKLPEYKGRNITAFLPGKDRTKEDPGEVIIIGASYDGVQIKGTERPYAMTATPAAIALELARKLSLIVEPLEKSVQFIFWDNEFETMIKSPIVGSTHYIEVEGIAVQMAMSHKYSYFDISYPGYKEENSLNLIIYPAQRGDENTYLMGLEMQKRLEQMDVNYRKYHYDYITTRALRFMKNNATASVGVGNSSTKGVNSSNDIIENINYMRMEEIGQIILDTITMNSYIMD